MLSNERFHGSRLPSGDRIELVDPEDRPAFVKPALHLSSGDSASALRVRGAGRRRPRSRIEARLYSYAASDTAPTLGKRPARDAIHAAAKRATDVVVSVLFMIVASPIFIIVALLVCASSPGPVLFCQTRLGKNGKPFACYKFRTMVQDAESWLANHEELSAVYAREFKIKDDPRITALGKLLRKTSLDELPQFLNVLEGSMSLVGPRPIVPPELEKYGPYRVKLLSVRPGLTGVWQVCGRSDTSYDERIVMDMFYVDEGSVSMDIALLWSTVPAVINRRGAY